MLLGLAGCDDGDEDSSATFPGTFQAESATVKTAGRSISRSNAEGAAVWHLDTGGEVSYTFSDIPQGTYSVAVRYSNDDTGSGDTIAVFVDGEQAEKFKTSDTGSGGSGWNVFVYSAGIALGTLSGTQTIAFRLLSSDGYGVDLDSFTFSLQ